MAKALTNKQRAENLTRSKKALEAGKTVTIDKDAIIDVPVLGAFRDYITETLHYIMSNHDEERVVQVVNDIRTEFKEKTKEQRETYDPLLNSVWCLMSLINEINHQAAEQGKTVVTDVPVDETISDLITQSNFDKSTSKESKAASEDLIRKAKAAYKKAVPGDIKLDNNKEENYDGEKKGKTSSED